MKNLVKLKKDLASLGKGIYLANTHGYDSLFEEFCKGVWRLNIIVDMRDASIEDLMSVKKIVQENFKDFNVIMAAHRYAAMEYWHGKYEKKNILLHIVPFVEGMNRNRLEETTFFFSGGELLNGENFFEKLVFAEYDWKDFPGTVTDYYEIAYAILNEKIPKELRLGMLKSSFLKTVTSAVFCKGVPPRNKKVLKQFFSEKFNDKKMLKIIDNFYNNKYSDVDSAGKDTIYFLDKLFAWKGFGIPENF